MHTNNWSGRLMAAAWITAAVVLTGASADAAGHAATAAANGAETFTAKASVKTPNAAASSPVTIRIDRYVSDEQRQGVMDSIRKGDSAATRLLLAGMSDVGYIEVAGRRTPIKYASTRPVGAGRMITVMTAQPLFFLGGAAPDAKPREGYDLALALLVLDERDTGDGELVPAAKVKMDDAGAIVTSDYAGETIRLTAAAKVK